MEQTPKAASVIKEWPEPIVRVQSISESGTTVIPKQYIKPPSIRPSPLSFEAAEDVSLKIPVLDISGDMDDSMVDSMSEACREWGFFHLVNHGVSPELVEKIRTVWREFFYLPIDEKDKYANTPVTYEGYGSRLGVMKGADLDWCDYFHLNFLPVSLRDRRKWPSLPPSCRDTIEEYGREVAKVYSRLMRVISKSLGLEEDDLTKAVGGSEFAATMRINFYPKCPQPDLTLGFSTHSDPGTLTILLPDDHVKGLQIRKGGSWVTVDSIPGTFVVNIADQIQVLSNNTYKSVEHRVMANALEERMSIAFFCNPKCDLMIEPIKQFVSEDQPAMYSPMTYQEYRMFVREKGPQGKSQLESLKSFGARSTTVMS